MQLYFIMHALYCLGAFLDMWGLTHTLSLTHPEPHLCEVSHMRGLTYSGLHTCGVSHMLVLIHPGPHLCEASPMWGLTHAVPSTPWVSLMQDFTPVGISHMLGFTHVGSHTRWANRQHSVRAAATTFAEAEPGYLFPLFLLLQLTSHFPADKPGALHTPGKHSGPFHSQEMVNICGFFFSLSPLFFYVVVVLFCFEDCL